jgi:hypothetical protein
MGIRIAVIVASILLASGARAQWNTQLVDDEGNAGKYCRMVNDLTGKPNIFYVADGTQIMHAAWTGSGWNLEHAFLATLEGSIDAALDRYGKWHLAIGNNNSSYTTYLYYVTNVTDTWTSTRLGSMRWSNPSIAVDTAGLPHIVNYCATTDELEHWWKTTGGTWQDELIESSTDIRRPSMVIDAQNRIYVGYYKSDNLMMAYRDASGWATNIVDMPNDVGDYCSLKLDGTGKVCISYYDVSNGDLKYAVGTPSGK